MESQLCALDVVRKRMAALAVPEVWGCFDEHTLNLLFVLSDLVGR